MKCLVAVQDESWAVLCSLTNKTQDINPNAGTGVFLSLLPAYTSNIFSSHIEHTGSILNYLNITWLAQNNASCSKSHPITYTTLYVHSGHPFATFNSTIMLTPQMEIHFQPVAMAPKGSRKGKGKATARAKMPTSVIHRRLSLDRNSTTGFISVCIRGLVRMNYVCGVKDQRARTSFMIESFLIPSRLATFSQFQLMWPHRRSRISHFWEWLAAFRSYMGQMFDKTRDQTNNCRWDNPRALRDQLDRSNPQTTSSGKDECKCERFSFSGSDDLRSKIEPQCCRQYKPCDILAVGPLNSDEIIAEDDDDENWPDPGALSSGRSRPGNDIDNDDGEGEEDTQGGLQGTGEGKGTKDGKGKGKATEDGKSKGKGKGKGNGKGKGIVDKTPGGDDTSATTLVSVRNTWVFRTALTDLMEPHTLCRSNTCYPLAWRRVILHTYLLYFVATLTHHQKDTCVTLLAGAAVMLKPFTQRLAMLNHSYYLSFNDFQTYAFSLYSHLCIYIATYLHMVYLDWQHAVIVSNSRCAWRWRSSELRDTLRSRDRASLEMHLEAEMEWTQRCTGRPWSSELEMHLETEIDWTHRCTWRPWSSEFGDAIGDRDWVTSEMHWEAGIERVWRCTWRPRSSELGDALWGRDRVSLEMQLETEIEWTQRYSPRPWSSEFGDALVAGCDRARLEEYLEVVELEAFDGRGARCWDSIQRLVNSKP